MSAPIIVDYREAELLRCLEQRGIPHRAESLPVGDIWVGIPFPVPAPTEEKGDLSSSVTQGLVIERKRITDFEASFLDGRYREQRGRILSFCQQYHTQPIYLLEGSWKSLTGRITKKAMIKLLNRLTLRYQLPMLHTDSVEETAEWMECLWEQWIEDPTALKRTQELVKVSDGIHIQKKKNASDSKAFTTACLAQCPGVSVKMADSLVASYPTLSNMMTLSVKELEEHKVGARRIGPVVAKRLWDLLHGDA